MNKGNEIGALVLRVSLGVIMIAHGLLKVMVFTMPGTAQFFESVGFPGWTAYPVTAVEIVGGLLLISGLWVRQVAIVLIPVMLGATSVHFGAGWVFSNANGGWEFPAFLTATLIVQALLGPGAYALRLPAAGQPATA